VPFPTTQLQSQLILIPPCFLLGSRSRLCPDVASDCRGNTSSICKRCDVLCTLSWNKLVPGEAQVDRRLGRNGYMMPRICPRYCDTRFLALTSRTGTSGFCLCHTKVFEAQNLHLSLTSLNLLQGVPAIIFIPDRAETVAIDFLWQHGDRNPESTLRVLQLQGQKKGLRQDSTKLWILQ
jgi:hypothetical protein